MGTARRRAYAHPTNFYKRSPIPFALPCSPLASFSFSLPFLFSLLFTAGEELVERRWRSDACEAPVSARHDRRADASSICANRANPPCVHCAPRADPACDRFAQTGQARPVLAAHRASPTCGVRRLAFPATGRSPFGAPRGISGPGPCSPLLAARQSLGGGAAFPPRSCAIRRTGHRYPEERVSRTSPVRPLTASGDTTTSLRLSETPPEAPLWSVAG